MFRVCAARSRLMKRGATYLLLAHSDGCARLRLALPCEARKSFESTRHYHDSDSGAVQAIAKNW
jgi:hypothetical protein